MLIGVVAGILFLLMIAMLLWSPLLIWVDTRMPYMLVEWKKIATIRLTYEEGKTHIDIKTLFYRGKWIPGAKAGLKRVQRRKRSSPHPKRSSDWPRKVLQVIKSFSIVRLEIALDTSNPIVNAQLFPLNFFPYPAGRSVYINFLGENHLLLYARSTVWRILRAWLSS